ncbi:uncharacterized protein EV422DRAFT_312421 [Fimicolochytrium jonesii]|uniref:uncharacterized protein n=1 Tax=Fimicolochytrium jonesii TaxID=1396493 RepID=UPI0022FE37D2|nr:uncharacterized protein EV422DRAFT_312421 [Fimicolochytrium jonesii]KAI8824237.1 hypothetical protein EV422DRAFT_312421 [Fimicolochytrium jonesii]
MVAELAALEYSIVACSSFHEENHPQQLVARQRDPTSGGWQTERFCSYPQALVIRFVEGPCRIRKLELLVHHYMIPTRIEFHIGTSSTSIGRALGSSTDISFDKSLTVNFDRLGYIALSDGVQVQYKARELKSVHFDAEGEYLKIIAHKCYVNSLNLYNQIGLLAVSAFGEPIVSQYGSDVLNEQQRILLGLDPLVEASLRLPHGNENAALWGLINSSVTERRIPAGKGLSFEACNDETVTKIMAGVAKAKQAAVREERYPDAKQLKALLEKCRMAAEEVTHLNSAKENAVNLEDYDTAARLKMDIDLIKRALVDEASKCGLNIVTKEIVPTASPEKGREPSQHGTPAGRGSLPPSPPLSKTASPPKRVLDHPPNQSNARMGDVRNQLSKEMSIAAILSAHQNDLKQPDAPQPTGFRSEVREHPVKALVVQPTPIREETPLPPPTVAPIMDDRPIRPLSAMPQPETKSTVPIRSGSPPVPAVSRAMQGGLSPEPFQPELPPLEHQPAAPAVRKVAKKLVPPKRETKQSEVAPPEAAPKNAVAPGGPHIPPGFEPPEPIAARLVADFGLPIEVFGTVIMQCLLGRQFGLREWAMEQVGQRIRQPVPDPSVDGNTLAEATYEVIRYCIDDKREKSVMGAISLWQRLAAFCVDHHVPAAVSFKHFDALIPLLLVKCSDINARVRQASGEMVVTLAKTFRKQPYSMYPHIFKPIEKKDAANWKLIKARLEVIQRAIQPGENALMPDPDSGPITLRTLMGFTEQYLHHGNVEVRDAAGRIVVTAMKICGEAAPKPYLSKLRPQQMATLQKLLAEANGTKAKKTEKSRDTPWATTQPKKEAVPSAAEAEEVARLQSQLETLRSLVDVEERREPVQRKPKLGKGAPSPILESEPSSPVPTKSSMLGPNIARKGPPKKAPLGKKPSVTNEREDWNIDSTCVFCGERSDALADEDNLDTHYWAQCPMLNKCPNCNSIVEIPMLQQHMLEECDKRATVKQCPKCKEVFNASDFAAHSAKKQCRAPSEPGTSRCPLCHNPIPSGDAGWRQHLLLSPGGCPGNKRRPKDPGVYIRQSSQTELVKMPSDGGDGVSAGGVAKGQVEAERKSEKGKATAATGATRKSKLPRLLGDKSKGSTTRR